ncbi:MAG: MFS transporter [Anaerolineales bacterium]
MANVLHTYWARVSAFHPNARLFLASAILTGAALGVYRLLFNFYVLSLGFDEGLLGQLITIGSLAAMITALPMGYLADTLGRKNSFLLGGVLLAGSLAAMLIWPSVPMFYVMNFVMGMAQALQMVTMAPFLLENSGEQERTYLFSLGSGLQMAAAFLGNSVGGYLPGWIAAQQGVEPTSSIAYAGALGIISLLALLGLIPLLWLKTPVLRKKDRAFFAPFSYARKHPGTLSKLLAPMLVTSIGAGLFMPFMNVFFRVAHGQPDPVIGNVLAWGALAMGVGLIIAPPLADRYGKIELVVFTQGISIPFLIMLGYAPMFWMSALAHYVRLALMNMSGPIYMTFVMEHVEPDSRATVTSLVSMVNSFGWAFSPSISGWLQVNYGFAPVYALVIVLYTASVYMYWCYFWKVPPPNAEAQPV